MLPLWIRPEVAERPWQGLAWPRSCVLSHDALLGLWHLAGLH